MSSVAATVAISVSHVVAVVGELDASNAQRLIAAASDLPRGARHIDATGVEFVGSAGLDALLQIVRDARQAAVELTIAPSDVLRRVAELAEVDDVLSFV